MIDVVLSFHKKPEACGVTKFNVQLAKRLGIEHGSLTDWSGRGRPLLSLKASELLADCSWELDRYPASFDVLWHDEGLPGITAKADRVFYATDLGCPSSLTGDPSRPGLTVLCFGFAHKYQAAPFERLKHLLNAMPYTICLSSAVHEGHPWDETTSAHEQLMRGVFGDHLRYLGFLADDALAKEIRDAHLIALFYNPGVRANNTTLWAALDAGTPVITNLDADSPPELRHNVNVFDLAQLTELPDAASCREVRAGGKIVSAIYSWDRVLTRLRAPVHA